MLKKPKWIIIATLAIFLAFSMVGCNSDPSTPAVVGKGNLANKIKGQTGSLKISAPQKVNDSFQNGNLSVAIDANVILPPADKLPVIKTAPLKFTQEQANKALKVLFQNKPLYYQSQPADGKFKSDGGIEQILVNTPLGKASDATFTVYNNQSGRITNLSFMNMSPYNTTYGISPLGDKQPTGIKMSLADATKIAEQTVGDIGSDLKLIASGQTTLGTAAVKSADASNANAQAGKSIRSDKQAYVFVFGREVNGVPSTFDIETGGVVPAEDLVSKDNNTRNLIEPHGYERITIEIDDSGVLMLEWQSPEKVIGTVSDNVQILSFDQVMDICKQQFFIHNAIQPARYGVAASASQANGGIKSISFQIDKITLGMMRIQEKDKQDEFLTVPVWDFFGTRTVKYTDSRSDTVTSGDMTSFLTINAIDGSIIDRSYGY